MKVSNEDKLLIGVAVVGVGVLGYLYYDKNQKDKELELASANLEPEPMITEPVKTTSNPLPVQGATLNKNLILRKGSKGLEVRELQRLLGVAIDGDFGNITLAALQAKKGVSEISINNFLIKKLTPKKANPTALVIPKVGTKLMSIKSGISLFNAKKIANGSYINDGTKPLFIGSLDYGDHIGTFVSAKSDGEFLVNRDGYYYFVNGASTKGY